MKQMTKEELIEYFIEQLGDNKILGKYITIEQIKEKLNRLIKDVTYNSEQGNISASWNNSDGIVNFDTRKIPTSEEKTNIIHELLHVLSTSRKVQTLKDNREYISHKVGLNYYDCIEQGDISDNFWVQNRAINEGITDFLADKITDYRHKGFEDEKNIYKVLSTIIGEDTILQKYFSDIEHWETKTFDSALNIFEADLIQDYGLEFGKELNNGVKKVLTLADTLNDLNSKDQIYGLNENGKRIQKEAKEEIYDTIYAMIEQIIDREPDILKKVELINKISETSLVQRVGDDLLYNILDDIINDDNINFKNKIDILKQLKLRIPEDFARDMILNSPSSHSLTDMEKLESYIRVCGLRRCNEDELYKLCVSSGIITESSFNKKRIFCRNLKGSTLEEMTTNFEKVKYKKVGDYYIVTSEDNQGIDSEIYKENGKIVKEKGGLEEREINPSELQDIIEEEIDCTILSNNLKSIIEEYKNSFKEDKYRRIGVIFYDGIIMIRSQMDLDSECFYKINQDGTLELIEQRRRKKIYRRYV